MLRPIARLWTLAVLLFAWQAPALATVGIGLHLAHDLAHDHHQQPASPAAPAFELALAATHGHKHDLNTPAHDHDAVRVGVPSASRPESANSALAVAAAPTFATVAASTDEAPTRGSPPRSGPPELFYRHHALLL